MKRTSTEHMDEDPAFYCRFSELIEETIQAYREGRLSQAEYLQRAEEQLAQMRQGQGSGQPARLGRYRHAAAYYGVLREPLATRGTSGEAVADAAIRVEELIEARKVRDWSRNLDVQKRMKRDLDDLLYELEPHHGLALEEAERYMLIERVLEVAMARDGVTR